MSYSRRWVWQHSGIGQILVSNVIAVAHTPTATTKTDAHPPR
ncbi:MAG: hypothetical protein NWS27_05785 [Ilumatobacteraceae bacterium]|nr:hypothetical protein [Ilumatobacteraceae bacterium]